MQVYMEVVGCPLKTKFVMADAAKAAVAAIKLLSDRLGVTTILMCFYHCVACVNKRVGAVPLRVKALVSRHLFKMHYSRSCEECEMYWNDAKLAWGNCNELVTKDFVRYFEDQWIEGDSSKWQVYHTPGGFPTTNNPCELFNKHLKGTHVKIM